jgi:hypothetical protein
MTRQSKLVLLTTLAALCLPASQSLAESYSSLVKQGYKTGKLSKNAARAQGWTVSNGEKKYFCRMKVTMAYAGSNQIVAFTSAGRSVKLDRKTFESHLGSSAGDLPQLSDLKTGKPRNEDVGFCAAAK